MERTQIPMPLQAQILMRLALAACSLIAGNVLLVFFTMTIAAPLFLLSLLAAVSASMVETGISWVLKLTKVPSMSKNRAFIIRVSFILYLVREIT